MILARYFMVGAAAAAVDFVIFAILVKLVGLNWFVSASISFLLATTCNYILSVVFVFESGVRFARGHEASLILVVSAMGLAMNQLALWLLLKFVHIDVLLAKIFATGVVFFWNFGVRRYFIFRGAAG